MTKDLNSIQTFAKVFLSLGLKWNSHFVTERPMNDKQNAPGPEMVSRPVQALWSPFPVVSGYGMLGKVIGRGQTESALRFHVYKSCAQTFGRSQNCSKSR